MNCTLNGFDGVGLAREDDLEKGSWVSGWNLQGSKILDKTYLELKKSYKCLINDPLRN